MVMIDETAVRQSGQFFPVLPRQVSHAM